MRDAIRTPVIVGAAQKIQRPEDPRDALDPMGMMEHALRDAADDAQAPGLLSSLDKIYVPRGLWRYADPAADLAARVGAPDARSVSSIISGHIVQVMIDRACREIANGEHDVVAIVGGESEYSKRRLARLDPDAMWSENQPGEPAETIGSYGKNPLLDVERKVGAFVPAAMFALCETALRHARGESAADHRARIAALSSRLSAVAAHNPHAWIQREVSADEIAAETAENRMVSYPYTKLMTANVVVDQSAALILCSQETARRMGIPVDRDVHLRAAVEMNDATHLSERQELHHHPGLDSAAAKILELAESDPADWNHIDLYSCFPFAVQASATALGLDENRPLTVTGGLTFSGGPFGNYVLQAAARLVELLRRSPGETGLLGSVGGAFAKFAYGIYSTEAGDETMPRIEDVSAEHAALPRRPYFDDYEGKVRVESYTVAVDREGPTGATFSTLTEAGERAWGATDDPTVLEALLADQDPCGQTARIRGTRIDLL